MDAAANIEASYDQQRRRLNWTMRGFWTMDDVTVFVGTMRAVMIPLGHPPYHIDSLCDASAFPVQSREVSTVLGSIDRAAAATRTGRFALVVSSVTSKLQVERTLLSDARAFLTVAEAEAWLAAPGDITE